MFACGYLKTWLTNCFHLRSFSPWTGTAIGKKNMRAFQCFVALVFTCLIMDIFLLTGAA
jgi:hypothetical protein